MGVKRGRAARDSATIPPFAFGEHLSFPQQALTAASRIRSYILETPLVLSPGLSACTEAQVFLKLENRQHSGSFKLRGAINKLLTLEERQRGIVTASSGNHGLAVAHAAAQFDVAAMIYLPETASPRKVEKLRAFPIKLCFVPGDVVNAEISARQSAAQRGQVFISPYNDARIIAGQGTIAIELLRQEPALDAVFVAVGGGGLMSGIAGYLQQSACDLWVVGCQPARSAVMLASVQAGRIVEMESLSTLSDGTAGGIEPQTITFDPCRQFVDEWLTVSEEEIAAAMRFVYSESGEVIEGAAGVAIASLLRTGTRFAGQKLAVVICGGNVDDHVWQQVMGL